jgi:hypothetical protein
LYFTTTSSLGIRKGTGTGMSAWDHLPNAAHIDRILASLKADFEIWNRAYHETLVEDKAHVFIQAFAFIKPSDLDTFHTIQTAMNDSSWSYSAVDAAMDSILALVAYEDSAKYLELSADQLNMLYQLNEHPACFLLRVAVHAFELERELSQG